MNTADEIERYMLSLINAVRAENGLAALVLERNLNTAAEDYSALLLDTGTFAHTGPDGSTPTERIEDSGFDLDGAWSTGENLGVRTHDTGESLEEEIDLIFDALMKSDGHRANILSESFTYVGIGVVLGEFEQFDGRYSVMVTQNFGSTQGIADLQLDGTEAADLLEGEAGDDALFGWTGFDSLNGGLGDDVLYGGHGKDLLKGGGGQDTLLGERGADILYGHDGNDSLKGGLGWDILKGGSGDDILRGGIGGDRLNGGTGDDTLKGGADADVFVFRGNFGTDVVLDFSSEDRLNFASNVVKDADDIEAAAGQTEGALVLSFGNNSVILLGLTDFSDIADQLDYI